MQGAWHVNSQRQGPGNGLTLDPGAYAHNTGKGTEMYCSVDNHGDKWWECCPVTNDESGLYCPRCIDGHIAFDTYIEAIEFAHRFNRRHPGGLCLVYKRSASRDLVDGTRMHYVYS